MVGDSKTLHKIVTRSNKVVLLLGKMMVFSAWEDKEEGSHHGMVSMTLSCADRTYMVFAYKHMAYP